MFENQNGFVGYPYQQPQMQAYTVQPQQTQKVNNYLTAEQIKTLQSQRPQFTLAITEEQKLRALCNHRSANGEEFLLHELNDGTGRYHCPICNYTITPIEIEGPQEEVKETVKQITQTYLDLVQTIKLMYVDMPQEAAEIFYGLIPLIEKTADLYDLASKSFSKYDLGNLGKYQNMNPGTISTLTNLMGMMGSNAFIMNSYQPQQQPQFVGGNPAFNPFSGVGYQNPQMGYAPQTNGFAYNPNPQPQVPTAAPETTTTTNVTV